MMATGGEIVIDVNGMLAGGKSLDCQPERNDATFMVDRVVAVEVAVLPAFTWVVRPLVQVDVQASTTRSGGGTSRRCGHRSRRCIGSKFNRAGVRSTGPSPSGAGQGRREQDRSECRGERDDSHSTQAPK